MGRLGALDIYKSAQSAEQSVYALIFEGGDGEAVQGGKRDSLCLLHHQEKFCVCEQKTDEDD